MGWDGEWVTRRPSTTQQGFCSAVGKQDWQQQQLPLVARNFAKNWQPTDGVHQWQTTLKRKEVFNMYEDQSLVNLRYFFITLVILF